MHRSTTVSVKPSKHNMHFSAFQQLNLAIMVTARLLSRQSIIPSIRLYDACLNKSLVDHMLR